MSMKHKKLPLFFLGILGIIIILVPLVPQTHAVSYYNWILGSEMETTTNYIEDGGFESGGWNNGVLYGNWSVATSPATIQSSYIHSGVYAVQTHYTGNQVFWYNFTNPILGAEVESFSFWVYGISYGNAGGTVRVYYSDGTYDDSDNIDPPNDETWLQIDLYAQDYIDSAKYIVALYCYMSASDNWAWDDFYMGITDAYSQGQYTTESFPWRIGGNPNLDMIGHNLVWGRNSNGSGYIGYDESTAQFIQDVDYVDSDTIHFIDLWAYTPYTTSVAVKINIIYSDRTYDTKTENITLVSTWEHLNFGASWIDDNKYIIQIQISLANYIPQYVNIDDVGIWSSLPAGQRRFGFSLSPNAISQTAFAFYAYQKQAYTLNCYLYDENGSMTESGSYQLSDLYGLHSGSFSSGQFSIALSQRSSTQNMEEQLTVVITTGDEVLTFELTGYWQYVAGGGGGGTTDSTLIVSLIITMVVLLAPSMVIAFECAKYNFNPILGFLGTFNVMCIIGVSTGLVSLWVLVVTVIIDVFLGLFALHSRGIF